MKVKAIDVGYYDNVRKYKGDVFDLVKDSHFSEAWMIAVGSKAPAVVETVQAKGKAGSSSKSKVDLNEEVI